MDVHTPILSVTILHQRGCLKILLNKTKALRLGLNMIVCRKISKEDKSKMVQFIYQMIRKDIIKYLYTYDSLEDFSKEIMRDIVLNH